MWSLYSVSRIAKSDFIKRDVKLNKKRRERTRLKYLPESEMDIVAKLMGGEELYTLVNTAFYSGARMGEVFAFNGQTRKSKTLYIDSQIDKNDVERDPKWESKRHAYLIPQGEKHFERWLQVKDSVSVRTTISKRFSAICKKSFKDKSKWCKYHDLLHSYAIYLLSKGVGLTLVVQSLGNSLAVAQEYYAGYTLVEETIETIDRIFRAN